MGEATFVSPGDSRYPKGLLDLEEPPDLWALGEAALPWDRTVAIVGTRHPTPYGQRIARRLAHGCARAGLTVVSGLAMGIDAMAHLGALDAQGGRTAAVMATGVDSVHPGSNRVLASRIRASGVLLSAYPEGTPARKHRFLERNQLIAAVSQVLVVVEGLHPSSGALSTVQRAQDLGREVLAVPGMITTPQAGAPNALLRDGCAPCLDVSDVVAAIEFFWANRGQSSDVRRRYAIPDTRKLVSNPTEQKLMDALRGSSLDAAAISSIAGVSLDEALDGLLDLELSGLVRRTPLGAFHVRGEGA